MKRKKELAEKIKTHLRYLDAHGYTSFGGLADCEKSYRCLKRLNISILAKLDICLMVLENNCKYNKKL